MAILKVPLGRVGASGLVVSPLSGKPFADLLRSDLKKVAEIRTRANITLG